jgi:hypothetical protein
MIMITLDYGPWRPKNIAIVLNFWYAYVCACTQDGKTALDYAKEENQQHVAQLIEVRFAILLLITH